MADYDFKNLSWYDFELLVRDLLQKKLKIDLESFAPGADQGIDLRYAPSKDKTLIVQCKHFASSGYSTLMRTLRKEVNKIRGLSPKRYVLATSLSLTPSRKSAISNLLSPYCSDPQEILGRETINSLLTRYKTVERDHFKLWLASTTVLDRLINAKLYSEGAITKEAIKRRIARYVVNPSVNRAHDILEDEHYCIIVGAAGIGKTTLAEILIARYINKGYQVFRIWEDIGDAHDVLDPSEKQIFYYDDFLGKTGLEHKLKKNEDERLIQFMDEVSRFPRTRFIMATRDYILSQGRSVYDALKSPIVNEAKCVVNLDSYTPFIRAHILYNHLHFSDLPKEYVEAIRKDRAYLKIAAHANYNPRIIQAMTDTTNVKDLTGDEYVNEFIANLDNPHRVWQTAYERHLSPASRDVLLCLSLLPGNVDSDDLKTAFNSFRAHRSKLYGTARDPYDFRKAVEEVDGSMMATRKWDKTIVCDFLNPSIQDFLESHLERTPSDLEELLASAVFAQQTTRAVSMIKRWAPHEREKAWEWIVNSISRQLPNPRHCSNAFIGRVTVLDLYALAIPPETLNVNPNFRQNVINLAEGLIETIATESHDRMDLVKIVDLANDKSEEHWFPYARVLEAAMEKAIEGLGGGVLSIEDYQALDELVTSHGELISKETHDQLLQSFESFMKQEFESLRDNLDEPESVLITLDEIESVANSFDIDLPSIANRLRDEANAQIPEATPSDQVAGGLKVEEDDTATAIDALFDTLGKVAG